MRNKSLRMGRARRLHRSKGDNGWVNSPRFEIGAHVSCKIRERWQRGRVVAQHYEEPEGVFNPYQVKLHDGQLIYAPDDDDSCIRKLNRELRFDIGAKVQCWYNEKWEVGHVVQHDYEEPPGVFHPYQVELHDRQLIYAPRDDDERIRTPRRFEVGTLVHCRQVFDDSSEQWVSGRVVACDSKDWSGTRRPYEVFLDDGQIMHPPQDDDSFVKRAPAVTKKSSEARRDLSLSLSSHEEGCGCQHHTLLKKALIFWRRDCVESVAAKQTRSGGVIDLCGDADTQSNEERVGSSNSTSAPRGDTGAPQVPARGQTSGQTLRQALLHLDGVAGVWHKSMKI